MSGTNVATEEELLDWRAHNVPSSNAIRMRGVINRSGMEPVAETV
jgi:hypothetical protein